MTGNKILRNILYITINLKHKLIKSVLKKTKNEIRIYRTFGLNLDSFGRRRPKTIEEN